MRGGRDYIVVVVGLHAMNILHTTWGGIVYLEVLRLVLVTHNNECTGGRGTVSKFCCAARFFGCGSSSQENSARHLNAMLNKQSVQLA